MIAACGIELKIGQKWSSAGGFVGEVIEISNSQNKAYLKFPNHHASELQKFVGGPSMDDGFRWVSSFRFTNKPNGYQLITD